MALVCQEISSRRSVKVTTAETQFCAFVISVISSGDIGYRRFGSFLTDSNKYQPVCWNCHVAETFRRLYPEMAADRPLEARHVGEWSRLRLELSDGR